jgi:ankyrin repeat protein
MSEAAIFFDAVQSGDLPAIRELLARTPSLASARDGGGATPLHIAAFNGNREVVRLLVAQGADVNARDRRFGATPAGWAIEYLRELGGFLGMEIDDTIEAIHQGDAGWVRRFLTRLPRLAACRDRDGKLLLQHAEESGHTEIAALFREALSRVRAGEAEE